MLNTLLYRHSEDFYGLSFLENLSNQQVILVAPSPVLADVIRSKISAHEKFADIEVLTIAKFIGSLFEEFPLDEGHERLNKASLMMKLGVGWKKFFKDAKYEKFLRAYNLLTDLRSFTLDPVIIETALEEYDEVIKNAVKVFYAIMESQGYIDEHKSYFYLSDNIREVREFPQDKKTIVFHGFNFFSGAQIDFLKALSIREDVFIPVSHSVFENAIQSDWVKWLDGQVQELPNESRDESDTLKVCRFSKKHLGSALKNNIQNVGNADIYLGTRNASSSDFLELSLNNVQFKTPIDLLSEDIQQFRSFFERSLFIGEKEEVEYPEFLNIFNEFFNKQLINKNQKLSQNLKVYKLKALVMNFLSQWQELSDMNNTLSFFDFNLMLDTLDLNSPRNSFVTYNETPQYYAFDINGLDRYQTTTTNIITAKSDYDGLKSSRSRTSLEVEKLLSSIGPIRRSEFEFQMLKSKLVEVFKLPNTILFIEEELEKHDLSWNSILESFELENITVESEKEANSTQYEFLNRSKGYEHTALSPTRLQSYIDCPKSFYFKYVEKIMPSITLDETLQLNDLGTLEHLVLEKYFEKFDSYSEENVKQLSKDLFDQFLATSNKIVSKADYNVYLSEIQSFANNGIRALFGIKDYLPQLNFEFELELKEDVTDKHRQGRVDFFANSTDTCMLIDFKRSSGSIPERPALLRLEKVQVWFYLRLLKDLGLWSEDKSFIIGYLNLSKHDGSVFITNNESFIEGLGEVEELKGSKVHYFDDTWSDAFENYQHYEDDQFKKMVTSKKFPVAPREDGVCRFCGVKNICPKSEVLGGES